MSCQLHGNDILVRDNGNYVDGNEILDGYRTLGDGYGHGNHGILYGMTYAILP
ncbi:MAG TPA: hypothetical protein VLG71_00115 [Candidatus Limnocylindria bacterium]|nr:hypothetical protein [Candidatus Limnocylindria bacterium]